MKTIIVAVAFTSLLITGCANRASVSAVGESEGGYMHVQNNKRQEYLSGSRLPRDSRENAESVKAMSRKGYQAAQMEHSGAPLDGQKPGM